MQHEQKIISNITHNRILAQSFSKRVNLTPNCNKLFLLFSTHKKLKQNPRSYKINHKINIPANNITTSKIILIKIKKKRNATKEDQSSCTALHYALNTFYFFIFINMSIKTAIMKTLPTHI